jgi:diguanylate cyclase (GGDEF)-like protein
VGTATPKSKNDGTETDQAIKRHVGLVGVLATAVLIGSIVLVVQERPPIDIITLGALLLLVLVSMLIFVRIRVRSTLVAVTWMDVAILVSAFILPRPVAVLVVFAGVLAAKLTQRLGALKSFFSIAQTTLLAAVAVFVLDVMNARPIAGWKDVLPYAVAFLAISLSDEIISVPLFAYASHTSIAEIYRKDLDIRWGFNVVRFGVAILAIYIFTKQPVLLIAVAPLALSLHLTHQGRIRARGEREAWQQLAESTDAFNAVQMEMVLRTAVTKGAKLFSADQVEVETWADNTSLLIRGNTKEITYFGQPDRKGYDPTTTAIVPLIADADGSRIGELRLRFRSPVSLSEREHFTLRAFAGALCTAIRNAASFNQLEQLADKHAHDASHDPLTGLPNRRLLYDEGTSALAARQDHHGVAALLLVDLNHFKDINDALGHAAGDQVLVAIAKRLLAAAGPDALVSRLGGDEFAVLYRSLPAPALAMHRAAALISTLREPVEVNGMPLTISGSAGVSIAPNVGGFVELMRRADIAMYQAKRNNVPVTSYDPESDTADPGGLEVGGMLPKAVADREFTLEYQPIVNLLDGRIIGAEALARWHRPDRGKVDPRSFLEPIERSGLLTAFTDAVLDQALAAAKRWREAGMIWPVAVNISPRSLLDRRLPVLIATRLNDHGLTGTDLVLELTESGTLSQLEVVDKVLSELRDLGCVIALDDFGTGFSSLSVLPRAPGVQEIKIDLSFVKQMEDTPSSAAVVRSTVELARGLDMLVVAEGVERESQRRMLWELGCTAGQGHLFAKPMPLEDILRLPPTLAEPLHDPNSVLQLPSQRRNGRNGKPGRAGTGPEELPTLREGRAGSPE